MELTCRIDIGTEAALDKASVSSSPVGQLAGGKSSWGQIHPSCHFSPGSIPHLLNLHALPAGSVCCNAAEAEDCKHNTKALTCLTWHYGAEVLTAARF